MTWFASSVKGFFASCCPTSEEVMHIFVFFLNSDFPFTKCLWCFSGYVFGRLSYDLNSFFRYSPQKKLSRGNAMYEYQKKHNHHRSSADKEDWEIFFHSAQSLRVAFSATYRNHSQTFVQKNKSCLGEQMDHTKQRSSSDSSLIEKQF